MFNVISILVLVTALTLLAACNGAKINQEKRFARVATFPVCKQLEPNCNTNTQTSAEILAASTNGMTLIYTDSPNESIGFVDIKDPASPKAAGTVSLTGEPTSLAVKNDFALVAVNTSDDFENVSGLLAIINIETQQQVHSLNLGGQPDSIAVSPDGKYAVVAIENERNEDLGDGTPPQLPAGSVIVIDIQSDNPTTWTTQTLNLTGLADLYSGDPEPEYVDINQENIAVITLQENNHIVLIDLEAKTITAEFSAGSVNLDNIDTKEEKPSRILLSDTLNNLLREPDGVTWINNNYFATANEGDLTGGSRGFSIFDKVGNVVWDSASDLEHHAARLGHYPDKRSGNKGNEPENIELGTFDGTPFLFVNSERANLVFVYDVSEIASPVYMQALPTAVAPEGGFAIPSRNLLVVASEEDDRSDKLRSAINIYQYGEQKAPYPTVQSQNTATSDQPIAWGALSALTAHKTNEHILYAVDDSFYAANRIFTLDIRDEPAIITSAITIKDTNDIFSSLAGVPQQASINTFDADNLAAMINTDKTVNIDAEGLDIAEDGGFWVASEGAGTVSNSRERPVEKHNFIFKTDAQGVIESVITLPEDLNQKQTRFGFEGIAQYNGQLYVTFQRAWGDEPNPRIGIYNIASAQWSFIFYPLNTPASQNGGWVGLSDITSVGDGTFLIIERDNQSGLDAAIKKIYSVNLNNVQPNSVVNKTLVKDMLPALEATGAQIFEKIEGIAITSAQHLYIINDNDGGDDNSGETQLIPLGKR